MQKKDFLFFDLDDTLVSTHVEMLDYTNQLRRAKGKDIIPLIEHRMTPENTGEEFAQVLEEAEFMRTTGVRYHFKDFPIMINLLRKKYPGIQIGFCTHRGYNKKAVAYTEEMLKNLKWEDLFDIKIYLDPAKNSDKCTYLDAFYAGRYILIDDNPGYETPLSCWDNIILAAQPWNIEHADKVKYRVKTLTGLMGILLNLK